MQLLKAMREQLGKTSAGRSVDAVVAASRLSMDRDTLDFHRSLHDLGPGRLPRGAYKPHAEGAGKVPSYL